MENVRRYVECVNESNVNLRFISRVDFLRNVFQECGRHDNVFGDRTNYRNNKRGVALHVHGQGTKSKCKFTSRLSVPAP